MFEKIEAFVFVYVFVACNFSTNSVEKFVHFILTV